MRNAFGCFLGALFQPRIDRRGHLRHFVDRCRNGRRFAEAVSSPEGLQLIGIHSVHNAVKQLAQFGITIGIVAALQHPIDSVVKIFARFFEMTGFEVLFAGSEFFVDLLDQVVLASRNGGQQPDVMAVRRIHNRQKGEFHRDLRGGRWRWSQRQNSRLHGLFSCVFAARQDC